MDYRRNAHYVFSCRYHIIFCPKYRRNILKDGIDVSLKEIVRQYAEKKDIVILEMEVMPDHVHLLLDCPPGMSPLDVVKGIKQTSAVELKKQFPEIRSRLPCLGTRSAFIATVGSASLETVKAYVASQKTRAGMKKRGETVA